MIGLEGKNIRSERLQYRLLRQEDRPALRIILKERQVTAPAGFLPAQDDEAFDVFFQDLTRYQTAIALLLEGVLIGYCRVNRYRPDVPGYEQKTCVSTGFVIGKEYHGQGYGTEMLRTVTAYLLQQFDACFADCFADLVGAGQLDACFADCFAENEPSRKTIEKCGYRFAEEYTLYFDELGEEKRCFSYVYP